MMRLLIVDDSNIIRSRIMRIVLAGTLPGAQIVGLARDGTQAVMMFKAHQPDVVTMDLTMVDVTDIPCELGDVALLMGQWDDELITAHSGDDVAGPYDAG